MPAKANVKAKALSPIDQIMADEKLRKFLRKIKSDVFSVDTKRIKHDISNMHRVRLTRNLKTSDVIQRYQTTFIEASAQAMAFRSSVVEKKLSCVDVLADLDEYLSILKKYLKSTYTEAMKKLYTTQADRDGLIDMVLEKAIRQKKRLEATIQYADIVILDLDATSRFMYQMTEAMKVGTEKRSVI